MPRTTAPDVYDALLARWQGAAAVDVQVFDAGLVKRVPNEYAVLTGISRGAKHYDTMGGGGLSAQKESYDLDGLIHCYTGGASEGSASAVRRRAMGVLRALDDAVQGDVTLGVAGVYDAELSAFDLAQDPSPNGGRVAAVTFAVTVAAFLPR